MFGSSLFVVFVVSACSSFFVLLSSRFLGVLRSVGFGRSTLQVTYWGGHLDIGLHVCCPLLGVPTCGIEVTVLRRWSPVGIALLPVAKICLGAGRAGGLSI